MSANLKRCFVIMPFSSTTEKHTEDHWDRHFNLFLKPLIESCNIEAFRSTPLRQDIVRQIVNDLVFSNIVVADLTDNNPNVYWELGVRQSFKHCTITIAEDGFKIPFNIGTKSILFYNNEEKDKKTYFEETFKKAIMDCLSHPDSPDSVVLETITGRGSIYAIIHREELIRRVQALISENNSNKMVFDKMINIIQEGKGKYLSSIRGKYVPAIPLDSSAIELLLAERYLEEDTKFYELVTSLHFMIQSINHRLLTIFTESSKSSEKFFDILQVTLPDLMEQYGHKLKDIHQKLISSL